MKVLLISHTCQSRTEGQPKAVCLHRMPGLDLRVLVPDRWFNYGAWRAPDYADPSQFRLDVGRVSLPWLSGAQFYLHWYPGLAKLLREFRPDVIDLWEEPWGLVSAHACYLRNKLLPGTRLISETEQNVNKRLPPPFDQFRRYTYRHADFVVCRNTEAQDVVKSKGYRGPMQVVPNAVDAELFRPLDRAACRRALPGIGRFEFVVGYVGRLVEEKGLLDLVDALEFCPPTVGLLLVGAGPLRSRLEQRARELGKEAQLVFESARPLQELPNVMNALDVLVLPSRTTPSWKEQFGRVIIEAYACGVPVLGSDSGAIPDVVGAGGLIFPEGDARALAAALDVLRADPVGRAEFGRAGRALVDARYTWQQVAEQMMEIYQRVMSIPAVSLRGRHE